jgi:hypothetical protein
LRIAVSRFGYPAPCGTFENGEMEDYTITFDHEDVASFMQVNLQGHREGFAAHLKWVTQTSLDINSYDVERSTDGINFEKINTGLADATTQNMPAIYNDTDRKPALGMNYYRLQVFPKDGAAFYTNVVALQFNEQKQRITIYPNPADEYVMVHLEDATEKAATLRLYNVFGQLMKQMKFDELPNGDIRIALDNLIDGSYY